ncbi:hypothetical protein ACWZHB_17380 [Nocardia sp. FBN12]|uniref:hypothetical protein n=1 Tax=Nocardia sp. FBN12 TaxID=3419766 RepID=UPI003D017A76
MANDRFAATTRYFRPSDPVAVSRKPEIVDIVSITDAGLLVWYGGKDTFGTPWSDMAPLLPIELDVPIP